MFSKRVLSVKQLGEAAAGLVAAFPENRVFAFYGKMGAGKTTFIQAICKVLGSGDNVTSPTFAIINEYTQAAGEPVYHFDFYRIKNIGEAYDIGYEDYFYSGFYCLIEWPEKIESLLPENTVAVTLSVSDGEVREISAGIK